MSLPCMSAKNLVDLLQHEVAFLLAIVEMRRNAHAGLRAIVDQDFSSEQLAADFVSVRTVDRNGAAALGWIFWRVHAPAVGFCAFQQARRHGHGLGTDSGDPSPIEDITAGLARVQRRYV